MRFGWATVPADSVRVMIGEELPAVEGVSSAWGATAGQDWRGGNAENGTTVPERSLQGIDAEGFNFSAESFLSGFVRFSEEETAGAATPG